jgi:hypothetical protein
MAQIPLGQKFHTLNANTPTVERGSSQADGLREIYTMQDIIDSVTTGGGIDFIELGDTPDNYTGAAGQAAIVNPTEDGLIFGAAGASELIELTDTPAGYGTTGQVLTTNGTDAATWEDAPSPVGIDLALNTRTNPYSGAGDHEGTVLSIGTLGLTVGTVYLWDGSGEWANANAGAVATADGLMGVATDTGVAPDVLVSGIIQLSSVPGSAGDVLYLNTTNGTLTATAPSGSGEIVRVMGYNLDGSRVYFNPSQDWLEIV